MADAKSDFKQNCIESVVDQRKGKIEKGIDESAEPNNHIKITDLNQYCLEKVFVHLDLEDLLNVSDANKCLRAATRMPFIWKYAGKSVEINLRKNTHYENDEKIIIFEKSKISLDMHIDIEIKDLKKSFQVLRCFGGLITVLMYDYFSFHMEDYFEDNMHIMGYIQEFCVESLEEVSFASGTGFECFEKQFLNVKHLSMGGISHLKMKCLSWLFPKLNCLHLSHIAEDRIPLLSEHFPNLHDVRLDWGISDYNKLANVFQLNPNIRSLRINVVNLNNFKSFSDRYLQSIESLCILNMEAQEYDSRIHLPNVKNFRITYVSDRNLLYVPAIPFSFSELKFFEIKPYFRDISFFVNFIYENPMIEKLTIWCEYLLGGGLGTGHIAAALPSLKDIDFIDGIVDTKTMLPILLPHVEFLRSFTFRTRVEDEEIRAGCGDQWRFYRHKSCRNIVTLERIEGNI